MIGRIRAWSSVPRSPPAGEMAIRSGGARDGGNTRAWAGGARRHRVCKTNPISPGREQASEGKCAKRTRFGYERTYGKWRYERELWEIRVRRASEERTQFRRVGFELSGIKLRRWDPDLSHLGLQAPQEIPYVATTNEPCAQNKANLPESPSAVSVVCDNGCGIESQSRRGEKQSQFAYPAVRLCDLGGSAGSSSGGLE
jgi:hypothetical protein